MMETMTAVLVAGNVALFAMLLILIYGRPYPKHQHNWGNWFVSTEILYGSNGKTECPVNARRCYKCGITQHASLDKPREACEIGEGVAGLRASLKGSSRKGWEGQA